MVNGNPGWEEDWKPKGAGSWGLLGSVLLHALILVVAVAGFQYFQAPKKVVVPVEAIVLVPLPPGPAGGGGQPAPVVKPPQAAPKPPPPKVHPRPMPRVRPRVRPKPKPVPPAPQVTQAPVIPMPAAPPAVSRSRSDAAAKARAYASAAGGRVGIGGSGRGGRGGGRGTGTGTGVGPGRGAGRGGGSVLAGYLLEIRRLLERQKDYPWMARRRHLQGVAVLRFTLAAGGQVMSAGVKRSSGHEVLDEAAKNTISRVGRFPPFPRELNRQKLTIEVPLAFRLKTD